VPRWTFAVKIIWMSASFCEQLILGFDPLIKGFDERLRGEEIVKSEKLRE
jgi:hypothetical protein